MKQPVLLRAAWRLIAATALLLAAPLVSTAGAQIANRVPAQADFRTRVELPGTAGVHARYAQAAGRVPAGSLLSHVTVMLQPSAAQEAALNQLLADQLNPSSPRFHQWLTPAQYGAQFGLGDGDLKQVTSWLQSQGLEVEQVAAGRNWVEVKGSVGAIENAFGIQLQNFHGAQQDFFEPTGNVQVPAALSGVIRGVMGLSSYRLRPHSRVSLRNDYTIQGTNGFSYYMGPGDFRAVYGLSSLLSSGFNGNGVTITVLGQSAVDLTQIADFQQLLGSPTNVPTLQQVSNTGTSGFSQGDEGESEADLEYTTATAPGANVQFVYTGLCASNDTVCNNTNFGVFTALQAAVNNNLGSILSLSYGSCELFFAGNVGAPDGAAQLEPILRQANAQGQTVLVASGDNGSAECDRELFPSSAVATQGATTSYPATSPFVTAVGGTQFNEGANAANFWSATNSSTGTSANGYIPEAAWNASNSNDIAGTGGGASKLFTKPNWQTGPGVPNDGRRDIPDVSFNASNAHDQYLWCSADPSDVSGSASAKCTATTLGRLVVGGTSLATPNFAAMLAIIESANGGKRLGNINPLLYQLAQGANAATVFHDVTVGGNQVPCTAGTPDCVNGLVGFAAGPGFDLATGIGSINGAGLSAALNAALPAVQNSATLSVFSDQPTPVVGTKDVLTATVSASNSATIPTGTVTFTINGSAQPAVALVGGAASLTLSNGFPTVGSNTVQVAYSGDSNYAAQSTTLTLNVIAANITFSASSNPGTLALVTPATGTETISFTSNNGFVGAVELTQASLSPGLPSTKTLCFAIPQGIAEVLPSTPGTVALDFATTTTGCNSLKSQYGFVYSFDTGGKLTGFTRPAPVSGELKGRLPGKVTAQARPNWTPVGLAAAGSLLAFFGFRRRRSVPSLLALLAMAGVVGLVGCGGGSTGSLGGTTPTPTPTPTTTPANYTLTLTAADAFTGKITAQTSFTVALTQ